MPVTTLRARWVLPINSPPIDGGVVTIDGERIVSVGKRVDTGSTVTDLGDVVLLPGLVNAHTHLEFSSLAEPLGQPGMALSEWIRLVIASRKQPSHDAAVREGLQASLRAGVTTLGEIATTASFPDDVDKLPGLIAFQEVIGFSAGRVESVFAELRQRLQADRKGVAWGISPHAPYTVHPALLEQIVELAREKSLPVAMHLAESPEELQLITENAGPFRELLEERSMWDSEVFATGRTMLGYLRQLSVAPRALVVHGNYLRPAEVEFLADRRDQMSVVYCPRTHAYFRHSRYPLPELMAAGVRVALGTDSRASNPDLSLLGELRFVAATHESISPEQLFALGTIHGAEALGLQNDVGSIAPGKLANLAAVACDASETSPARAVLQTDGAPQRTWLRGCEVAVTVC